MFVQEGVGVRGRGERPVDNFGRATITVQERRQAEGLDAHVPIILRDGALYDSDLDRFFLDLPLNGTRSPHSLRAYGYDVVIWVRFLAAARGKTVWAAQRDDIDAFHRARRREDAGFRISAASWNRSVASLEKLYRWAELDGLIAVTPFTHRTAWRRGHGGRRGQIALRNEAYERAAKRSDVRFVQLDDYRVFRDVGLRGLAIDGSERAKDHRLSVVRRDQRPHLREWLDRFNAGIERLGPDGGALHFRSASSHSAATGR